MADKIMAALDYLDAHNTFISQKPKIQRPLGNIDGKYDADPFDLPLHLLVDDRVVLTGTSRTNLSRGKTIDQILDEDREKVVRSAHRSSSATLQKSVIFSRPQTSLSSGSAVMSADDRRRPYRSASQIGSTTGYRTSTKKLIFTPPGVSVGPTDARDEVMEEIVNKPLTHTPTKTRSGPPVRSRTATSAPLLGQQSRISVGCRSMTSLHRAKTSHGGSRQGDHQNKKYEMKPGPFATIKVSGPDMWVVSSSTPTSYFNGDLSDQSLTNEGSTCTKHSSWEDTANSVPREEKKSPPRYQRQLGAPPQFGPTHQWYSFSAGSPTKQRPVLTAFADETDDEYYSIESNVGQKVAALLQGSPGIRIGVNGQVVAQSMKMEKKKEDNEESEDGESLSEFEDEPKKNSEDNLNGEIETSSVNDERRDEDISDTKVQEFEDKEEFICSEKEEDKQFSLLRYLGVAKGENPYVVESSSDTTSSTDIASLLNIRNMGKNGNTYNEQEEALWKILEGTSPNLWMSKEKWRRMQTKMKEKIALQNEEGAGPLSWSDQFHQQNEKVIESRKKSDSEGKHFGLNGGTPVVFHKFVDYENLPSDFVHLTSNGYRPHSSVAAVDKDLNVTAPSKGFQSTISTAPKISFSATNENNSTTQEKFPPRPFTSQSHVKPDVIGDNKDESRSAVLEVADIMQMSSGDNLDTAKAAKAGTPSDKKVTGTKPDDVSAEELEAIRMEAAYKMKMTGGSAEESVSISRHLESSRPSSKQRDGVVTSPQATHHARKLAAEKSVTLNSLPVKAGGTLATVDIRPSKPSSSMPVSLLNLTDMEEHYNVVNGPNPTPSQSARVEDAVDVKESHDKLGSILKNKIVHNPPFNTPMTPVFPSTFHKEESVASSPKHPDPHSPSSVFSRLMTDTSSFRINRPSKSASFASRSSIGSPRSNLHHANSGLSRPVQNRSSDGFVGSPLSSKPAPRHTNRFIGGSVKSAKASKPVAGASLIPHGNTYADLITKSGFIQISHPIHFGAQHLRATSAGVGSGNKMYDSYMHELSSRSGKSAEMTESEALKSGTLFGKRLGGTSGKLLPEYMRRPRQQNEGQLTKSKAGYSNFTVMGGRRSGLAITSEQARLNTAQSTTDAADHGGVNLGLQGGQLRLNLDKNIHVIYRDLGIPKKTSKSSSVVVSRQNSRTLLPEKAGSVTSEKRDLRSAGSRSDDMKSRPHSAKVDRSGISEIDEENPETPQIPVSSSGEPNQILPEDLKISIIKDVEESKLNRNLAESSVATENGREMRDTGSSKTQHRSENSSAKSRSATLLSEVVDSGTQWSPHEPREAVANAKFDDETRSVSESASPRDAEERSTKVTAGSQTTAGTDEPPEATTVDEEPSVATEDKEEASMMEAKADEVEVKTEESDLVEVGATEELPDARKEPVATEELPEEEFSIRGVTKVTVNIATSG